MSGIGYDADIAYNAGTWTYAGAAAAPTPLTGSFQTAIRTILRTVPSLLGANWYYSRLTSGPASQTRTHSTPTVFAVLVTNRTTVEEYDNDRQAWTRRERARARCSDALLDLHQGDQLIDPDGVVWAVMGMLSSGIGTTAYHIERVIPLQAAPNRRGGV